MAYADYTFYTGTYLGTAIASQADFDRLAMRASAFIDRITFGRAAPVVYAGTDLDTIGQIKLATCAVAEEHQKIDNGIVTSERVGQHSVNYAVPTMSDEARMAKAARLYLAMTDLMYRGLDEN